MLPTAPMACVVRAMLYREGLPHEQIDKQTFQIADFTYDFADQRLTRAGGASATCAPRQALAAIRKAHPDLHCAATEGFYPLALQDLVETAFGLKDVEHTCR